MTTKEMIEVKKEKQLEQERNELIKRRDAFLSETAAAEYWRD